MGPWWSSSQRARLLLLRSEFKSRWSLQFLWNICVWKERKYAKKIPGLAHFYKKRWDVQKLVLLCINFFNNYLVPNNHFGHQPPLSSSFFSVKRVDLRVVSCVSSWMSSSFLLFKIGHSWPLFYLWTSFYKQFTVNNCTIKVADDWIRTWVLWYQKQLRCQLSHNNYPYSFSCLIELFYIYLCLPTRQWRVLFDLALRRYNVYSEFRCFIEMGQPQPLFRLFLVIFKQTIQFLHLNAKNVHPVYGARIWTHNLSNMSHHSKPLDQGSRPTKSEFSPYVVKSL